jgi:hypothetical protein
MSCIFKRQAWTQWGARAWYCAHKLHATLTTCESSQYVLWGGAQHIVRAYTTAVCLTPSKVYHPRCEGMDMVMSHCEATTNTLCADA